MNKNIFATAPSPERSNPQHKAVAPAPEVMKTTDCQSDAEWYFRQSAALREFYEVFFDTCHTHSVTWSQASPAVKELISDLVKLTLDRNAAERKLRAVLSSNDARPPK